MNKIFIGLIAALFLTGTAYAGQTSTTLTVSTTVGGTCGVTTTPLEFTNYDGTSPATVVMGNVSVQCPSGVPYNVAFDAGQNFGLGDIGFYRAITDGLGTYLEYTLYDQTLTNEYGDADFDGTYPAAPSLSDLGNGSSQPHQINGYLNTVGYVLPPGTYSDTVNITVYF